MVYLTEKGKQYLEEWKRIRGDFSHNLPGFIIEEFPVSGNEGLYGMTLVPSDGKIGRRTDLYGTEKGLETDLHECGHDPGNDIDMCEYRTRLLARERLKAIVGEEKNKYRNDPEEYKR